MTLPQSRTESKPVDIKCSHCGYVNKDLPDSCVACHRELRLTDFPIDLLRKSTLERTEAVNAWVRRKWDAQAKADQQDRELYGAIIRCIRRTSIRLEARSTVAYEAQRLAENSIGLGMKREDVVANPSGFVSEACRKLDEPLQELMTITGHKD